MPNTNETPRPATLTVRLDQFSSLEAFVRGYRQHVSRTSIYLPTRVPRPEGSLLLFRIELSDGSCAFRGEGTVASFRHTPGGDQLGLTLRLRRLDRASKELHAEAFSGSVEASDTVVPGPVSTGGMASLAAAIGAAAEEALDALAHPPSTVDAPVVTRDPALVTRNEGEAPARIRDDLRPAARASAEAAARPQEPPAPLETDAGEQTQALGRMAVARMSVDEYEARKAAMVRAAAPPPVASLMASSESTAAWSEADDALDFEGIGSDIRENVPVEEPAAPKHVVFHEEEPLRPAPTLPPLEGIVVAKPEDAVGGGVTLAEVTFSGASAYEMPKSAPIEAAPELDLDFDFTAVAFTSDEGGTKALSGNRAAISSSAVTAVASALPMPPSVSQAAPVLARTEAPVAAPPAAAPPVAAVAPVSVVPSRLPPPPPPKGGAPVSPATSTGSRAAVPMSKPIPRPTAGEPEEKPGLFGWLRGKK